MSFDKFVDHLSNDEILEDIQGCLDVDLETGLDDLVQELVGAMGCGYLPLLQAKFIGVHADDQELEARIIEAENETIKLNQEEFNAWSASDYE